MNLTQMLATEEPVATEANPLTTSKQLELSAWGMRMFTLGRHLVSDLKEFNYGGRLIILQEGSKREVNELDTTTAESRSTLVKAVVIDDSIWQLDHNERVRVEEEL
jgi:hypothetical protein